LIHTIRISLFKQHKQDGEDKSIMMLTSKSDEKKETKMDVVLLYSSWQVVQMLIHEKAQ